jgi:hypothetical protein
MSVRPYTSPTKWARCTVTHVWLRLRVCNSANFGLERQLGDELLPRDGEVEAGLRVNRMAGEQRVRPFAPTGTAPIDELRAHVNKSLQLPRGDAFLGQREQQRWWRLPQTPRGRWLQGD